MTDKTPTGEKRLVAHSVRSDGKSTTVFTHADVCRDGKVRIPEKTEHVALFLNGQTKTGYGYQRG